MIMEPEQLDAFPECVQDSPRLGWLKQHNLTTGKADNGRWRCWLDPLNYGVGATEEEAITDFCIKTGVRHYSLDT